MTRPLKIAAEALMYVLLFAGMLAAERYAGATGVMAVFAAMLVAIAARSLFFGRRTG
jgi:NhaP-type Na+/H+ or K+/H+ antiporter